MDAHEILDPPDDILKETLQLYAKRGYSIAEKLTRLQDDHQLSIR
jgi:hypothetical protein